MIKMTPPKLTTHDVFSACISRIRSKELKKRMGQIAQTVTDASVNYNALAAHTRLHQFPQESIVAGLVTTDEMERLYTQRMAKKGAPGRDSYDVIISSSPNGKCPLCGHRIVSTLDHHLPKSKYPVLAVTPLNLVPICSDCNKAKLDLCPTSQNNETLHPYYDDIEADRWLVADLAIGTPAALKFRVEVPAHWSSVLGDRVALHFKTLGLARLYAAQAADELLNIRHQLRSIHQNGGKSLVGVEMAARARSCRDVTLNGWRFATYDAFANSDWFCDGGFDAF